MQSQRTSGSKWSPHSFVREHLDPAGRLGEILFALIMALGFTAAVRITEEGADNRELFLAILGCNVAWAIVDGVLSAITALFERGRNAQLVRRIQNAAEDDALKIIDAELDTRFEHLEAGPQRQTICKALLAAMRQQAPVPPRLEREDVLTAMAVGLAIILVTLPVVAPFLLVPRPDLAVRLSNLVALVLLFGLGAWWARQVGHAPLRVAVPLTIVGLALVAVTIVLGG